STAVSINVVRAQPGLLAPVSFNFNGRQYAAATFSDGAYVLPPGAIPAVGSRRARPGDTIILYGIGFGAVTPDIAAGQIAQQSNRISDALQFSIGGAPATVSYAGLAPNFVGLYQFNLVVPTVAASDAVPVTFTLGGVAGTQTLYLSVQN